MTTGQVHHHETFPPGHLRRTVGFYGLMFVSLGSIIGSGWLLGALNAAEVAGPPRSSPGSWPPPCCRSWPWPTPSSARPTPWPAGRGGSRTTRTVRSPGSSAGWASWLQAVVHRADRGAGRDHLRQQRLVGERELRHAATTGEKAGLLNGRGLVVAMILMVLFTAMNLAGAKFLSESNSSS